MLQKIIALFTANKRTSGKIREEFAEFQEWTEETITGCAY
jgi:hypothetical protein